MRASQLKEEKLGINEKYAYILLLFKIVQNDTKTTLNNFLLSVLTLCTRNLIFKRGIGPP